MNFFKKALIFPIVFLLLTPFPIALGANGEMGNILEKSSQDLTLLVFAGVGGGVLGLSTLSFVDEPGDHLDNITVGIALGIIAGVCWVAYTQAVNTYQELGAHSTEGHRWDRMVALRGKRFSRSLESREASLVSWSWQF